MRTKIKFTFFLLVCVLFVSSFKYALKEVSKEKTLYRPSSIEDDSQFLITAMHSGIDTAYNYYPQLGVNGWHKYTGPTWGWPNIANDRYDVPTNEYAAAVLNRMERNRQHGLRSIMDRPKIQYTAFAQRSDYQCEAITEGQDYWFYSYNTSVNNIYINDIIDNSSFGAGAKVKYCQPIPSGPGSNSGYIVKDLRSNREQANKLWNAWMNDDTYKWYVMPRIRIDTAFANNSSNLTIPVCRIEVYNWDSSIVKSAIIKVRNFKKHSDSVYNGQYLEEYYFNTLSWSDTSNLVIDEGDICPGGFRWFMDWGNDTVKTDFRVYWYGLCDMWIDYVRVENQPAHELFKGQWDNHIREETQLALTEFDTENPIPNNFYIEEFEFNIIPCMAYVNNLIMDESLGKLSLMVNMNYGMFRMHIPDVNTVDKEFSAEEVDKYLVDRAGLKYLVNMSYILEGWQSWNGRSSYHPTTLSTSGYSKNDGILSYPLSVPKYEDTLQWKLDISSPDTEGFVRLLQKTDSITKYFSTDLKLIHLTQAHLWWAPYHQLKEPSNEELSLMVNLSISYGAKGIMYFAYNSDREFTDTAFYERGLVDPDMTPRTQNVYGQNKWAGVQKLDSVLNKWGSHIMNFDNTNRKSFIYRFLSERTHMASTTFLSQLKTYLPVSFAPPNPTPDLDNFSVEPADSVYLQAAFFNNPNDPDINKYFMIVNRRCSPFINYSNATNIGGQRLVALYINPAQLPNFNTWRIYNLETGDSVRTFNKNDTSKIYLGNFNPGEGRLYRVAPVMQEGGKLLANESIGGVTFNCNGNVYNNGKNVTVYVGTNINFAHGVKWDFSGGEFRCGLYPDEPNELKVNMNAQQHSYWKGLKLQNAVVEIYNTNFSYIRGDSTAIQLIDCFDFNVSYNEFNLTNADSTISLSADFLIPQGPEFGGSGEGSEPPYISAYINHNEFNVSSPKVPTVKCLGYDTYLISLMMDRNIFNSTSGKVAVMLSNVAAANIKNNKIHNYKSGINLLSPASYADLYNNIIDGDSICAQVFDGTLNLGLQGEAQTGGFNIFTSENTNGNNLNSHEGYYSIYAGLNTFDIDNSSTDHLAGTFYFLTSGTHEENAIHNCFKVSNDIDTARESVTCIGLNCDVTFEFDPTVCAITQTEDYMVIEVSQGVYDTIFINGGGGGSGSRDIQKHKSSFQKIEEITAKEVYDIICLEMRKQNYELVQTKCFDFLTDYPDSIQSMDILSKLYYACLVQDSLGNEISPLKSFYETLILNHGDNEDFVKKTFYLIQKCKVKLEQYQSAMDGFQQIVLIPFENFPIFRVKSPTLVS